MTKQNTKSDFAAISALIVGLLFAASHIFAIAAGFWVFGIMIYLSQISYDLRKLRESKQDEPKK